MNDERGADRDCATIDNLKRSPWHPIPRRAWIAFCAVGKKTVNDPTIGAICNEPRQRSQYCVEGMDVADGELPSKNREQNNKPLSAVEAFLSRQTDSELRSYVLGYGAILKEDLGDIEGARKSLVPARALIGSMTGEPDLTDLLAVVKELRAKEAKGRLPG